MTPRQREFLDFLRAYAANHGDMSPTLVEISRALGIKGRSGVHRLAELLIKQGLVERTSGSHRNLRVVADTTRLSTFSSSALLAEIRRRGLLAHGKEALR